MSQATIAVVTGANRGIGQATALELARQGATVVMVCRHAERGQAAQHAITHATSNANVHLHLADLSSQASIRHLAAELTDAYPYLTVLVNNAGVYLPQRQTTADGLEAMFATNHLAYFLLTHLLLDHLRRAEAARILNISAPSTTRLNFDDLQSEQRFRPLWAFGASKAANLLFTLALAERLAGSHVTVNAVHPGLVRSNIMDAAPLPIRVLMRLAAKPSDHAARHITHLALDATVAGQSGLFYKDRQPIHWPAAATDRAIQQRLWDISLQLTHVANEE